jgi:hypothetical protein
MGAWVLIIAPWDKALGAVLYEPTAPLADRVLVHPKALGDLLALQPLFTKQDHPAPIR